MKEIMIGYKSYREVKKEATIKTNTFLAASFMLVIILSFIAILLL